MVFPHICLRLNRLVLWCIIPVKLFLHFTSCFSPQKSLCILKQCYLKSWITDMFLNNKIAIRIPKTSCLIIVTDLSYGGYVYLLLCGVELYLINFQNIQRSDSYNLSCKKSPTVSVYRKALRIFLSESYLPSIIPSKQNDELYHIYVFDMSFLVNIDGLAVFCQGLFVCKYYVPYSLYSCINQ